MKIKYFPQMFDPRSLLFYVGTGFKCRVSEFDNLNSLRLNQPFQMHFVVDDLKSEDITSELICIHDKSTMSVSIAKITNQIRLTITPQSRGKHELHNILSGDSHICGSPIPAYVFIEPQQLSSIKPKSLALNNATAIKCHGNQVMVSLSLSSLAFFAYEDKVLILKNKLLSSGINEFCIHKNLLYYSDVLRHRLVKADMNGDIIASTGSEGSQPGQFQFPNGIRVKKGEVFVCDSVNNTIQIFDTDLNLLRIIGEKESGKGQLKKP